MMRRIARHLALFSALLLAATAYSLAGSASADFPDDKTCVGAVNVPTSGAPAGSRVLLVAVSFERANKPYVFAMPAINPYKITENSCDTGDTVARTAAQKICLYASDSSLWSVTPDPGCPGLGCCTYGNAASYSFFLRPAASG